jgi:geranylgeranyl diphosphate synthase type II
LLGCALQVGALLCGASDTHAEQLLEIGIQLGMAFQIQDDILDAYGDETVVG